MKRRWSKLWEFNFLWFFWGEEEGLCLEIAFTPIYSQLGFIHHCAQFIILTQLEIPVPWLSALWNTAMKSIIKHVVHLCQNYQRGQKWEKHEVFRRAFIQSNSKTNECICPQIGCCLDKWNTLCHVEIGDLAIEISGNEKKEGKEQKNQGRHFWSLVTHLYLVNGWAVTGLMSVKRSRRDED